MRNSGKQDGLGTGRASSKMRVFRALFWQSWAHSIQPFRDFAFRQRIRALGVWRQRVTPNRTYSGDFRSAKLLKIVYISLESRRDRRKILIPEFQRMGFENFQWFSAIRHDNGALGCAKSHLEVLNLAKSHKDLLMVCEDDIGFWCDGAELESVLAEFASDSFLDVLQLDIRPASPLHPYNASFNLSNNSYSTGCYVIKPRAFGPLLRAFSTSAQRLERGLPQHLAAVDVVWKSTQQRHLVFATPLKRLVYHRSGVSDIVGRFVKLDT